MDTRERDGQVEAAGWTGPRGSAASEDRPATEESDGGDAGDSGHGTAENTGEKLDLYALFADGPEPARARRAREGPEREVKREELVDEYRRFYLPRRNPADPRAPGAVKLAGVVPEKTFWIWPGRIPFRAVTLLDGDPGLGKSLLALDIATRLTTGRQMPDGAYPTLGSCCTGVVILAAEDDHTATIVPRLSAMGADLERVLIAEYVQDRDTRTGYPTMRKLVLPGDIAHLGEYVRRVGAWLVIIDPLVAFIGVGGAAGSRHDARSALRSISAFARHYNVAVLALRPLSKSRGADPLYRGAGSIELIGAARSGLIVGRHPDDPETDRVLATTKNNLGPTMPALRYRIQPDPRADYTQAVRIEWLGTTDVPTARVLAAERPSGRRTAVDGAASFLQRALANGARQAGEIEFEAQAAGIELTALRRARLRLGVQSTREGFGNAGRWIWTLPAGSGDSSTQSADATTE